jgi:hypothetical protein
VKSNCADTTLKVGENKNCNGAPVSELATTCTSASSSDDDDKSLNEESEEYLHAFLMEALDANPGDIMDLDVLCM